MKKVKVQVKKRAKEPEVLESKVEVVQAESFVDDILNVQKFLVTHDINRTSNLDTLLWRARKTLAEKLEV